MNEHTPTDLPSPRWWPLLRQKAWTAGLWTSLSMAALLGACEACKPSIPKPGTEMPAVGPSTLRLYMLSDLAGALEPCGCVKEQLGGLDHAAAWMDAEKGKAQASVLMTAGPLFFLDTMLDDAKREQEVLKAKTLARGLRNLHFAAFAPGRNDWAAGPAVLEELSSLSGASLLFANGSMQAKEGAPTASWAGRGFTVVDLGAIKLGIVGVSRPDEVREALPVDGLQVESALASVRAAVEGAKGKGANVFVALASVGRGEAKRIAESVPELTAVLVGSPGRSGDSNTTAPPVERIGQALVIETANHLQNVAVVDLHVRDGKLDFADGAQISLAQERGDLDRRIQELRGRLAQWEIDSKVPKADVAARKADLSKLEGDRAKLDARVAIPQKGSFFRYTSQDVRDNLGRSPTIAGELLAYYKDVNEKNRVAFADRKPRPPGPNEAGYVGVETCSTCHAAARAVWDKTPHSRAYGTLVSQFKEFNLDCALCHVTGYEKPGGSTLTHVETLKNVQCEVCHGPGAKHVAGGGDKSAIVARPSARLCESCHHPPHVHEFDAQARMADVLGPGHGRPL
jgi:hypothetical protein